MNMDTALRKVYQYAEPNLSLIGWMGVIFFPTYYVVWEYIFPQEYESLPLRIICSLLIFCVLIRNKLNSKLREYMYLYYQVPTTICLPFFFSYMLLMNDWSTLWLMSLMSAIFLHILLVHVTKVLFIQAVIGVGLAVILAWIEKGFILDAKMYIVYVPIFVFTYLFGNLCYIRNQVEHESKVSIAKVFGASIAHEMRNPLSALNSSLELIQTIIPNLKEKKEPYQLSEKDINLLQEISADGLKIIDSANETIDLLLTSIDENRVSSSTFKMHTAQDIVESTIDSYGYKRLTDRLSVSTDIRGDFCFFGSSLLLKYVLYNLLKNSFNHRVKEYLYIHIIVDAGVDGNRIIVRDNGSGITPEVIDNIFNDFYTTGNSGNYGLGLPFCKRVLRSFGGNIECDSKTGEGAQFSMTFPLINSKMVAGIKHDLIKFKSFLIVSEQENVVSTMTEFSRIMGFNIEVINVASSLKKKEHEFEYDVIFIDIESLEPLENHLDIIESLMLFTEAIIVYIYQYNPMSHPITHGFNPIYIETQTLLRDPRSTIERLLFDTESIVENAPVISTIDPLKRTIMVVDDTESLRQVTTILLERQGFDVIQCEDGQQAIKTLDVEPVDLILMDIEMPVMDGIETSLRIRELNNGHSSIPIIAYTGDDSAVNLDNISSSGMSDFIIKPAGKDRILNKISDWI